MAGIEYRGGDVARVRSGSAFSPLWGLMVLALAAVSTFAAVAYLFDVAAGTAPPSDEPLWKFLVWTVALIALLVAGGVHLLFRRTLVLFDRTRGTVFHRGRQRTDALKDIAEIAIDHEPGEPDTYPVQVVLTGPQVLLEVIAPLEEAVARREGIALARFLGVKFRDRVGGIAARLPEEAEQPLLHRPQPGAAALETAARPASARSRWSEAPGSVSFVIPHRADGGDRALIWAGAAAGALITVAAGAGILGDGPSPMGSRTVPYAAILGSTLPLFFAARVFAINRGRTIVTADGATLRVSVAGMVFRSTKTLSAADIQELRGEHGCVTAVSRDAVVRFGWGLDAAELAWMRARLESALRGIR